MKALIIRLIALGNARGKARMLLFLLCPLLIISPPLFAQGQTASDPWMAEMENAKGLTVGDLTPKYGEPDAPTGDDGTDGDDGAGDTGHSDDDTGDPGGIGPSDPNRLDPNTENVTNYIRQWLSVAKPPQNAVPGSNWSYDKFGRVVGSGPGMKVTSTHDSVDYGSGTPEASAWSLRKELDSIDHCTLEEYVIAMLGQESISHCAGRYSSVNDLKGVSLNKAKATIADKGFTTTLTPGSPALTPEEEGTVERQEPGPEQYLKKGDTIKLFIHAPYVPAGSILPDFKDTKISEVKEWLQKNGFAVSLKPGTPAPTVQLTGMVETQDPAAGVTLLAGEKVILTVYSPFVDVRTVPNLVGENLSKAKAILQQQGFKFSIKPGSPAPAVDRSGTIEAQNPGQGTQVAAGAKVSITVHSNYINTAQIPDVQGLIVSNAKEKLAASGFAVKILSGPSAPKQEDSGKVIEQQPAAGAEMERNREVAITIYSPYVQQEEQAQSDLTDSAPEITGSWDCSTFDSGRDGIQVSQEGKTLIVVQLSCYSQWHLNDGWRKGNRVLEIDMDTYRKSYDDIEKTTVDTWNGRVLVQDQSSKKFSWAAGKIIRKFWEPRESDNIKTTREAIVARASISQPWTTIFSRPYRQQKIQMPNVIGLSVGHAKTKLTASGFTVKLLPGPPAPSKNDSGKVVGQQPGGGTSLKQGAQVALHIYSPFVVKVEDPIARIEPVEPVCQCRVDSSLMKVEGSSSCSTFKEAKNSRGENDIHGLNVVIHVVNDRYARGGNWTAPSNWHYGRGFINCQELFNDELNSCANFCSANTRNDVHEPDTKNASLSGNWSGAAQLAVGENTQSLNLNFTLDSESFAQGTIENGGDSVKLTGTRQGKTINLSGSEEGATFNLSGNIEGRSASGIFGLTAPDMECVVNNMFNNTNTLCPQTTYRGTWSAIQGR